MLSFFMEHEIPACAITSLPSVPAVKSACGPIPMEKMPAQNVKKQSAKIKFLFTVVSFIILHK